MRGFSLLETLVYLALFAILIGGFVVSAYSLFESNNRNAAKAMLEQEKIFVVGKLNWALSGAETVSTPVSGSSGSTLSLTKYDGTPVTVGLSSGAITVGGNQITNSNVTVSNLVFIHVAGVNPESVEAGFTISTRTVDGKSVSQTASTTRYIRK